MLKTKSCTRTLSAIAWQYSVYYSEKFLNCYHYIIFIICAINAGFSLEIQSLNEHWIKKLRFEYFFRFFFLAWVSYIIRKLRRYEMIMMATLNNWISFETCSFYQIMVVINGCKIVSPPAEYLHYCTEQRNLMLHLRGSHYIFVALLPN